MRGQEISFDSCLFADTNSQAFRAIGSNAVPLLLEKLGPPPTEGSWERSYLKTRDKLPQTAKEHLPLPSTVLDERFSAIEVAYIIGPDASGAVPGLISILKDEKRSTIRAAVMALGSIGPAAHPAAPDLCKILEAESPTNRITSQPGGGSAGTSRLRPIILKTLGQIGPDAKQAVPLLLRELDDYPTRVAEIRQWTNYYNQKDVPKILEIRTILANIEKKDRLFAAWSLWQIDSTQRSKVVPILIDLLQGEEFWDCAVACDTLNYVSCASLTRSIGSQGRAVAAKYLGELGATEAVPELQRAVASKDMVLSKAAERALEQIAAKSKTQPSEETTK